MCWCLSIIDLVSKYFFFYKCDLLVKCLELKFVTNAVTKLHHLLSLHLVTLFPEQWLMSC